MPCSPESACGDMSRVPRRVHQVVGLERPVEILVDAWGVPHIYAATHYDAFVAQGFNAARDRLWQIDLWRRRGLGQLAAVLGEAYVAQDRANRLFLYRGDMYREWLAYGSGRQAHRHGVRRRRQRLRGVGACRRGVLAGRVRVARLLAGALAGRRRRAHSQPRLVAQRRLGSDALAPRLPGRRGEGELVAAAAAGLVAAGARWPRPMLHSRGRVERLCAGHGVRAVRCRCRAGAGCRGGHGRRQQQLGHRAGARRRRQSHPRQ